MLFIRAFLFTAVIILVSYHVQGAKSLAHVLLVDASCGAGGGRLSIDKYWAADMERKKSVLDYPVNITVELFDTQCNSSMYRDFLQARVDNATLPPLSMIIGPGGDGFRHSAELGASLGIPALTYNEPSSFEFPLWMSTTFGILPPFAQSVSSTINAFSEAGAKTVVAVAVIEPFLELNEELCLRGGVDYAKSRGYTILGAYNFTRPGVTQDALRGLVHKIRDELKPDVIMWCDLRSGGAEEKLLEHNILTILKSENYVPKGLLTIGFLDSPWMAGLRSEGLTLYTTSLALWSPRLKGRDYTQEDNPYSNYFRPNITISSVIDDLNTGALPSRPSSNEIFVNWYESMYGFPPTHNHVANWAQFDMAESALYRAAKYRDVDVILNPNRSHLAGSEVMATLRSTAQRGVFGAIHYNKNRINDAVHSITLQDLELTGYSDIVAPKSVQTKALVYPMPSWDDRVYEWKLLTDVTDRAALCVAIVCAAVLIALGITAFVYRATPEIRMIDYRHIVLMCLASALVCFGLALFWQSDVDQAQCDAYLWVVVLPLSFVVQLSNMKAHRLSVFLRLNGARSKSPFTHAKVMGSTLLWLLLTVAVLLIVVFIDPPKATRFIEDPLRPKFDHYECKTGSIGDGLLYGLFAVHFAVSIATTIAVRNGSEAFRDGTVIKESFILFYVCIAFAFIVDKLGVDHKTNFFIRTVFVALGTTLLNVRLLSQRCVRHWIPENFRTYVYRNVYRPLLSLYETLAPTPMVSASADGRLLDESFIAPMDIPADNKLDDMYNVFRDPERLAIFSSIADKLLIGENVEFIAEVLHYKQLNVDSLKESTVSAGAIIRQRALLMFEKYVRAGAECEINISHALNRDLETSLAWDESATFLSKEIAERALDEDILMRNKVFDAALKEVAIMLYQNMWTKFVEKETELQMGADFANIRRTASSKKIVPAR